MSDKVGVALKRLRPGDVADALSRRYALRMDELERLVGNFVKLRDAFTHLSETAYRVHLPNPADRTLLGDSLHRMHVAVHETASTLDAEPRPEYREDTR